MVNHYKNCEKNNGQVWNAELVLRPHLWMDRLHLPAGGARNRNFHARFMQPGCYELDLRAFISTYLPTCLPTYLTYLLARRYAMQ